jgi:hypothetical protein
MAAEYYHLALEALDDTGIENAAQSWLRELAATLCDRTS